VGGAGRKKIEPGAHAGAGPVQARAGLSGSPREAHEKAVITGADRENFWQMVEAQLIAEHLPTSGSAKSQSKKTRWV